MTLSKQRRHEDDPLEGEIRQAPQNYLGLAYSEGIGIERSRFVSADWYVKAGEQFDKQGDRASALQALEDALQVVPAYPAALELRSKLVK